MKKLDTKQKSTTVGGMGYKMICRTENWVGPWYLTYNGAVRYANAHKIKKPGHTTDVFKV